MRNLGLSLLLIFSLSYTNHSRADQLQGIRDIQEANAKASEEAEEKNLWTGVSQSVAAVVCTVSCIYPWLETACTIASPLATAHDIIENQALSASIAASGIQLANAAGVVEFDGASCFAAGFHALTAAMKFVAMDEAGDAADDARSTIPDLAGGPTANPTRPNIRGPQDAPAQPGETTSAGITSAPGDSLVTTNNRRDCEAPRRRGDAGGFFSCLTGSRSGLASPEFAGAFNEATGFDLGEFIASIRPGRDSVSDIISSGISRRNSNSDAIAQQLTQFGETNREALLAEANRLGINGGGVTVASKSGKGGRETSSFAKKKSAIPLLAGKKLGEDKGLFDFSKFGLEKGKINAEAVMADRNRNIFERVSRAYVSSYREEQVQKLPWATDHNQITSRLRGLASP